MEAEESNLITGKKRCTLKDGIWFGEREIKK